VFSRFVVVDCHSAVVTIGMMETVRIRRSGYPVRRTFEDFLFRYNVLGRVAGAAKVPELKQKCVVILKRFELTSGSKDWQPGHTKVRGGCGEAVGIIGKGRKTWVFQCGKMQIKWDTVVGAQHLFSH